MHVIAQCLDEAAKQDDVTLWVGKATTGEVEFEIVPAGP